MVMVNIKLLKQGIKNKEQELKQLKEIEENLYIILLEQVEMMKARKRSGSYKEWGHKEWSEIEEIIKDKKIVDTEIEELNWEITSIKHELDNLKEEALAEKENN